MSDHLSAQRKRAVIYRRVSTQEQVANNSFFTQEEACRSFCKEKGWDVVGTFDEPGQSAKTLNRKAFQALLKFCKKNKGCVEYVVVYDIDRFSRNTKDALAAREELESYGVSLRSVNQEFDETPHGNFNLAVAAAHAQLDNDKRTQRTVVGMKAGSSNGLWLRSAPIGYLNTAKRGILAIDPKSAPLLQKGFEMFAAGGYSKAQVLKRITEDGLRYPKSGRKVSNQEFGRILRSPIYGGRVVIAKWGVDARCAFESVVSPELFAAVQARLDGRRSVVAERAKLNELVPLKGFLRCGYCHRALTGAKSVGKNRNRFYVYYDCYAPACRKVKSVPADYLHERFQLFLESLLPDPAWLELFLKIVKDVWKGTQEQTAATKRELLRSQREFERNRETLDQKLLEGLSTAQFNRLAADNDRALEAISEQLEELKRRENEELDIDALVGYAEYIYSRSFATEWFLSHVEEQSKLQRALFPAGLEYTNEAGFSIVRTPGSPNVFNVLLGGEASGEAMVRPE